MASPEGSQQSPSAPGYTYKRASRKGAEKKFRCTECPKVYSRAEHLQRHQLNHNPKVVYKCQHPGCYQAFVRKDLLDRHERRHSASYQPRNRASSFNMPPESPPLEPPVLPLSPAMVAERQTQSAQPFPQPPLQSAPLNASVLLTPDSDVSRPKSHPLPPVPSGPVLPSTAWSAGPMDPANMMRPKPSFMSREALPPMGSEHTHSSFLPYSSMPISQYDSTLTRDNFAMWLFDPQRSYGEISMANVPFFDGGLESAFNNNIHYDHESLTSRSQLGSTSTHATESSDDLVSEMRRCEVLRWVDVFRQKQPSSDALMPNLVMQGANNDLPGLSLEMMRACVRQFWESVSPRMPIVHQPTFSSNRCAILLLMVMIGLGAASLSSQAPTDTYREWGPFADLVITYSRWEIVTDNDSAPPTELWVAQALLLVEFYEKMLSNRKLHERAHIYHSVTLTLLRRGSPLIGRAGSESPPDAQVGNENPAATDARTWWSRWADTEAMHRVVYAAFMMDIIHAAMFGHTADMAPHEIRLPLPCDETLWLAASPEKVREQEASLRITDAFVRSHDHHERPFECRVAPQPPRDASELAGARGGVPSDRREKWSKMLLTAFDGWKSSFDKAMGTNDPNPNGEAKTGANGLIQSAAVLYHLAQFSLYIDIVDCQVYAGAKRLLGRKITTRDFGNVVGRMRTWSNQPSTRHAVLHAFKLLNQVLVDPFQRPRPMYHVGTGGLIQNTQYSCRNDPDPHRPWILYYATLSIWCFVQALGYDRSRSTAIGLHHPQQSYHMANSPKVSLAEYLSSVANLHTLDKTTAASLGTGLPDLLDTVGSLAAESHSELLQEAHGRLEQCREILGRASQ
ncbi:zinc finger protein zas1 [Apiospora marii]|uniref:zinc finger protein zas1 n=1 Tax=Apiospora marii TaxID=335849 RepID=UPI00312D5355